MSCLTLSSSICRGCRDNAGGIRRIYAANVCEVTAITVNNTQPSAPGDPEIGEVTAITNGGSWYELVPNKNSSNWVENINASVENGTLFYEQVVTAVFGKNDQVLRNTIEELNVSDLVLVVEDNNGKFWLIGGVGNGAYVSGGNSASGTAYADLNGWNITITCQSPIPARTVSPSLMASTCGC